MITLASDFSTIEYRILEAASNPLNRGKDIALQFGLSHERVKNLLSGLYQKLGAENRWHAVEIAKKRGII